MTATKEGLPQMEEPVPAEDIARLQSVLEFLYDPDRIGLALHKNPKTVEHAVTALKQAAEAPSLPERAPHFPKALNRVVTPTIQRLRRYFALPHFWVQSGLTRRQILALADSFEKAIANIARRSEDQHNRAEEARRKSDLARQRDIHKRTRHIK
jgi:hypothetical protein